LSRTVCLAFGGVYILVFILGLVMNPIFGIIPVNAPDGVLHLLLGVGGIGAGLASGGEPAASAQASLSTPNGSSNPRDRRRRPSRPPRVGGSPRLGALAGPTRPGGMPRARGATKEAVLII
jgi:hypothetical protein